jgi:hypothetical protein
MRPGIGGGSNAWQRSTELLLSSGLKATETVWWLGLALIMGWANSWTSAGLRPGKWFSLFFSTLFILFYFLFSVLLFLIQICYLIFQVFD